jgi:hypothetical protein
MFDRYIAPGATHISADVVCAELHDLRAQVEPIKKYTDKRVAHFDKKGPQDSPTVLQVHDALDRLYELVEKYLLLLRVEKYKRPQLEDTWKDVFREPWIR